MTLTLLVHLSVLVTVSLTLANPLRSSLSPNVHQFSPNNMTFGLNLPSSMQNLSASPHLNCDGHAYGQDLSLDSCMDALSTIPSDTDTLTFGDRGSGNYNIHLPYRWISCQSSTTPIYVRSALGIKLMASVADGRCIFDIIKSQNTAVGHANIWEFRTAAARLAHLCLGNKNRRGGIATNIGKFALIETFSAERKTGSEGRLGLIMTSYSPNVNCVNPPAPLSLARHSCGSIISQMPTTLGLTSFIPTGQAYGGVKVPHIFNSRKSQYVRKLLTHWLTPCPQVDRRCQSTVTISTDRDFASWYHIWEAVVAIDGMCGRFGQIGLAHSIGGTCHERKHRCIES